MFSTLSNPTGLAIFGNIPVGPTYAYLLIAVFVIQAIALAIYIVRRVRSQFRLLDEGTLLHRRAEAGEPEPDHQKKDVWV